MIRIQVRSNLRETIAELRSDMDKVAKRATVMALNRTAEKVRTEAGREVRKVYNLKLAAVRKAAKLLKARQGSRFPRAEVSFSGQPIPLIEFAARAVNPWNVPGRGHRRRGGGVSVQIRRDGPRKVVQGAFISALSANNYRGGGAAGIRAVFRRVGMTRLPIRNLRSISIPSALENEAVAKAIMKLADDHFDNQFEAALAALVKR